MSSLARHLRDWQRVRSVVVGCLLAAVIIVVTVSACDTGGTASTSAGSTNLTVYTSLPLQGPGRARSESIVKGMKLALAEQGSRVGAFTIKINNLDDSTAKELGWEPGQTSENARNAAQDKSTIAYIGDFDSGATAISIPILDEAGILQVSPGSTYLGLTRAGSEKAEPEKFYPAGRRNFGRVVPNDGVQIAAQVMLQQQHGCTRLYVVNDRELYGGLSLAKQMADAAAAANIEVVGNEAMDPTARDYASLTDEMTEQAADCMFFAGFTRNHAVQLFREAHAANPTMKLFGSSGVADAAFVSELGTGAERQTYLTSPALDPKLYPEKGQEFLTRYQQRWGSEPDPYAIYGYEAMQVVLLAIQNAGDKGNDRAAVIDAFFKIRSRDSVLGDYSFDKNGDTSLRTYGGYRVRDGQLEFDQVLKPEDG